MNEIMLEWNREEVFLCGFEATRRIILLAQHSPEWMWITDTTDKFITFSTNLSVHFLYVFRCPTKTTVNPQKMGHLQTDRSKLQRDTYDKQKPEHDRLNSTGKHWRRAANRRASSRWILNAKCVGSRVFCAQRKATIRAELVSEFSDRWQIIHLSVHSIAVRQVLEL
jgi:hypothetical protein